MGEWGGREGVKETFEGEGENGHIIKLYGKCVSEKL